MSLGPTLTTLPGQLYVLFSYVGPDCPQKCDKFGIKVYGVCPTVDIAKEHAKKLQSEDATFDILVADVNQWLLLPPQKDKIDDTHYVEEKLEEIIQERKKNQRYAAAMFEKRKQDMMAQPLDGSTTPYIDPSDEYSKYYSKPDVPRIKHPSEWVEQLKLEFPGASMETLVKVSQYKVLAEIEQRRSENQTPEESLETVEEVQEGPPELLE
jgi:hypothetical protein